MPQLSCTFYVVILQLAKLYFPIIITNVLELAPCLNAYNKRHKNTFIC